MGRSPEQLTSQRGARFSGSIVRPAYPRCQFTQTTHFGTDAAASATGAVEPRSVSEIANGRRGRLNGRPIPADTRNSASPAFGDGGRPVFSFHAGTRHGGPDSGDRGRRARARRPRQPP